MQLVGFDHLQLAIPAGGEEQARRFYGDLLGLRELPKPAALAGRGGCWFEAPGVQIHLGVEQGFVPARKAHPAFLVADLVAAQAHLAAAGVESLPDTSVEGVRRFYAHDPFGNRLEFIQNGEGFGQHLPG